MAEAHRTALALLAAVLGLWFLVMALALARADVRGPLVVAVFPLESSATAVMTTVTRAGGRLVRRTWWPSAFVVEADDAVVAHLAAAGGVWLLPAEPFRVAMVGGCGFARLDLRVRSDESGEVE
jgi:hypothetical protein